MAQLAALMLGSCATRVMTGLVSLVLSSCQQCLVSRQQELLHITCEDQWEQWDVRRDSCECIKDPGQGSAVSTRGVVWAEQTEI